MKLQIIVKFIIFICFGIIIESTIYLKLNSFMNILPFYPPDRGTINILFALIIQLSLQLDVILVFIILGFAFPFVLDDTKIYKVLSFLILLYPYILTTVINISYSYALVTIVRIFVILVSFIIYNQIINYTKKRFVTHI